MSNIGHNNPPPEVAFSLSIDDLYDEARNFLDGEPIETEGQANAVGVILTSLKKIRKDADAARAEEKRPHDEAAKAVQAKWKPLLDKADRVINAAQRPITDYLARQEAARIAEAERLAEEARKADEQAQAAMRNVASLDDAERAEELIKEANKLAKAAKRSDKAKSHVAGVERAIGLRTYWTAEITDPIAFGKWAWSHRQPEYLEFLTGLAAQEARGARAPIPGVLFKEVRKAA